MTGKKVCIDTAPFIYYIERRKQYAGIVNPIFESIDTGNITAITTTITLLEVLVHPYRTGNHQLADKYRDILLHAEGLTTIEISHEISEQASKLRAGYSISTPDAIQISTALIHEAEIFLTNDEKLKRISEVNIECLND